ncbi:MAG TPA: flavodoxin family protein, partial [Cellvibrio sp.]|nr:flavodoxin family protein [Cellvibrio sp.]
MRYFLAITVIVVYIAFCLLCWVRYRQRERLTQNDKSAAQDAILVAYASQTGNAEKLAQKSVQQLEQAGLSCKLLSLHKVDESLLAQTARALFVVSTYGEGEPPDTGAAFLRRYLKKNDAALAHLQFGILTLGDRDYGHFC